jgi:hypothetical protein
MLAPREHPGKALQGRPRIRDRRAVAIGGQCHGMQPRLVSVNFRLSSPELGLEVQVRLREANGRWLAVADFGDEPEVGLGASARTALTAALATVGPRAAAALLADPELFGVSTTLRANA